jgi:hypothetical protein
VAGETPTLPNSGAIQPGSRSAKRFQLHVDYKDLAGREHASDIVIQLVAKKLGNEIKREFAFRKVAIS